MIISRLLFAVRIYLYINNANHAKCIFTFLPCKLLFFPLLKKISVYEFTNNTFGITSPNIARRSPSILSSFSCSERFIRKLRRDLEKPLPPRTDNERRSLNLSFRGVTVEGWEENFEGIERYKDSTTMCLRTVAFNLLSAVSLYHIHIFSLRIRRVLSLLLTC